MAPIPVPIRQRILKLYDQGKKTKQIAEALGYCKAAVRRVRQHHRERGTLVPQTHQRSSRLTPAVAQELSDLVAAAPDATLAELAQRLSVRVGSSTIDRWLAKLKLSLKKSRTARPSRIGPT